MSMKRQDINFSNDLGYGSVKGSINGNQIIVPSIIDIERRQDMRDPLQIDYLESSRPKWLSRYMSNFLDHLDVSIKSKNMTDTRRMMVGNSAKRLNHLRTFDVSNTSHKASTNLSMILTLSIIAGEAVREQYLKTGKVPTGVIRSNVNMVTALPIIEGSIRNREQNSNRYQNCNHVVIIHNFDKPIRVHIYFTYVLTYVEGEAAQYAIIHARKGLRDAIKADFKKFYPKMARGLTGTQLSHVKNVLGIDIGEGTTDIAVFENGRPNAYTSRSIQYGYGTAINGAMDYMNDINYSVNSRISFKHIINEPSNPLTQRIKTIAVEALQDQISDMIDQISKAVSQTLRSSNANALLIYVYGGGSIPLAKWLRSALEQKGESFRGGNKIPVIFIDKKYAQYMNMYGLRLILSSVLAAKRR